MNIGIICEFNPFHKGHKYLIDKVKNEGNKVICVMSGNFVQRGECAVFDKFQRARTAIENKADIVIELPAEFSTFSAREFAKAGVSLLEKTGVCDAIAFGAECDNVEELINAADKIKEKDAEIKEEMKKGVSYPVARQNAVNAPVLDYPNNILATEYLLNTTLKPICVKRIGKGHDSDDEEYSASEIRKTLSENETANIYNIQRAILCKLRTMTAEDFKEIDDVSEGLENRIVNAVKTAKDLDELYDLIKTKRYTHSRIRRIILRAFLGIKKEAQKEPLYIRILAFSEEGRDLLKEMKKFADLPLIIKYSDAKAEGGKVLEKFEKESLYTDIYNLSFKVPRPSGQDKTEKITRN